MQVLLKYPLNFLPLVPQIKHFINPKSSSSSSSSTTTTSRMSSWECKSCTFLNPPSQLLSCQICHTSSSSSSSSSSSFHKWGCKACTFLNPYTLSNCEMCGTRVPSVVGLDDFVSGSGGVGSVFFPLRKCSSSSLGPVDDDEAGFRDTVRIEVGSGGSHKRKFEDAVSDEKVRTIGATKGSVPAEIAEDGAVKNVSGAIKILSYNVWFRDELEGYLRMQAIGNLIQLHSPDVICFQEVNSVIYDIFQKSSWWKKYRCSVSFQRSQNEAYFCMQLAKLPVRSFSCRPFSNTYMCRELCIADVELNQKNSLVIATSHLESPCPGPPTWDQMFSKERVSQAKEAISVLKQYPNVIFCGDMNWDDKLDGRFPFTDGWFDAWEKLRPAEVGYTYDTKSNKMLTGNRTLQKRLDRFMCHLPGFKVISIDMIGTEPIPGLEYRKEKKVRGKIQELMLPVYPSDHYGLLLTITTV